MADSVKLKKAVTTALKDGKVTSAEASRITGAVTYANERGKLSPADVKLLQKVASLPESAFEDRKHPDAVKSQRTELREYAETIQSMQGVSFEVRSAVPGIEVKLSKDFAIADLDSFGYQHERILEVTMKDDKAKADGTVAFSYGAFKVSVEVKKGQSRDTVVGRIESALLRQQEAMSVEGAGLGEASSTVRFMLHRFKPLTAAERRERVEWMGRFDPTDG